MTNISTSPPQWFVNGPSKSTRTVDTLPPALVEQARKMAIGARIKDARERSRWRQQDMADHLEVGQRKRVNVTVPVSGDQIDAHQSANSKCSAKANIVGQFGPVQ